MAPPRRCLLRAAKLGDNLRATQANCFPRQTNEYEQAGGDHASSQTDPDVPERLTGICGSDGVWP